jgi:hypothetical protein
VRSQHEFARDQCKLGTVARTKINGLGMSVYSFLDKWEMAMQNIISLLKPQSTFILSALGNSTYYHVHNKRFPAVKIDETLLMSV